MTRPNTYNRETQSRLLQLKSEFSEELYDLLDFWSRDCLDEEHGGFVGRMDHFGKIDPKASKSCVLNTRILWTFSAAYRTLKKDIYKQMAERAYQYLIKHFWDAKNGGLYWELDHTGKPLNTKKQAYVQGFGIYAFSEYYRAVGEEESLGYAKQLFYLLETHFWDPKFSGYLEALTSDWQPLSDMRLSNQDLNAPKSMNTHLHIIEPYTNLFRVWPAPDLKLAIASLLQLFERKIFNQQTKHLDLFFNKDWTPQFQHISYGHDIEAVWLLNEASMEINKGKLDQNVQQFTQTILKATRQEGLDTDGALFYARHGAILDKDKHWWPQAEAMVGFMDAYQQEGDQAYLENIEQLWRFIKAYLKDTTHGEWYWRVDDKNLPVTEEDKAGFWKCPYHNTRALMELIARIDVLTAKI